MDEGTLAVTRVVARVGTIRGSCTRKSSSKRWELASVCGGEGWETETPLPKKNFSICVGNSVSLFHTREDSAASRWGAAHPLSTRGMRSTQGAPRLSHALQVCHGFYSYNSWCQKHFLGLSKYCPSKWFPSSLEKQKQRKKNKQNKTKTPTVLIFDVCTGLVWMNKVEGLDRIPVECVFFHAAVCEL